MGREREEALRKEKGLQPSWTSTATKQNEKEVSLIINSTHQVQALIARYSEYLNHFFVFNSHVQNRKSQRVGGGGEDKRDVQHRLATSIIQKEIDETSEREIELVKHGKIQTTSIQRVDSKVTMSTAFQLNLNLYKTFKFQIAGRSLGRLHEQEDET